MRSLGAKVEIADKGCSGIDGGWGVYDKAKIIGKKMMEVFSQSKAEVFVTELAGLQIFKASGKRPLHPIKGGVKYWLALRLKTCYHGENTRKLE